ncbi:MAG: DNA repair protein RecO [Thermodesulfobacteriota bacterium]
MKFTGFTTDAILLRRIAYGDHDLILTFLAPDRGKFSSIAKSARKSVKRFSGLLEPFTGLQVVCTAGRGKLLILKEAALRRSLGSIRSNVLKTAYAGYWVELVDGWLEEGQPQTALFHLLGWVLDALEKEASNGSRLSVLFQMRLLALSGFSPNLCRCACCRTHVDGMPGVTIGFDLAKGGVVCARCGTDTLDRRIILSKGTAKQLHWLETMPFARAGCVRFTARSLAESLHFLETFVPYHLGKQPRSLAFLKQIRPEASCKTRKTNGHGETPTCPTT